MKRQTLVLPEKNEGLPACECTLGESNLSHLSAVFPSTYEEPTMPGGAESGATADIISEFSHSLETRTGNSLLDAIRVLTDMPPNERAALIELLKTWG